MLKKCLQPESSIHKVLTTFIDTKIYIAEVIVNIDCFWPVYKYQVEPSKSRVLLWSVPDTDNLHTLPIADCEGLTTFLFYAISS